MTSINDVEADLKKTYSERQLNPHRLESIRRYAGSSVLDIGCGNGAYVRSLADQYDIRGVDYRVFDEWSEHADLFKVSDAADISLPDNSVDTVLSFETLEHLENPDLALREYYRICRKNTILTVPNCKISNGLKRANLIYSHWRDPSHRNFFDMDSILTLVKDAGFQIKYNSFINEVRLGPLIAEALGIKLNETGAKIASRLFKIIQRRKLHITSLIVAEKL